MATIIGFSKWTDQGVRNYRETVDRLEQAKELAKWFDAEITATLLDPPAWIFRRGCGCGPELQPCSFEEAPG